MRFIPAVIVAVLLFSGSAFAGLDDYHVGLKAYKDEFYDVSEASLMSFLKDAKDSPEKNYAYYMLYRVYIQQNKYKEAKKYFEIAEKIDDKRFDRKLMERDKLRLTAKSDCKTASAMLKKNQSFQQILIYADSECPVDTETASIIAESGKKNDVKLKAVKNAEKNPEAVEIIFNSFDLKTLSNDTLDWFAKYFYENKRIKAFWKVYETYPSKDTVQLGFARLWSLKEYKYYTSNYLKLSPKFNLDRAYHCYAIESFKQTGQKFDCDIIDKCIPDDSEKRAAFKSACFIKNKEFKKLELFVNSLGEKEIKRICGYGGLILENGLLPVTSAGRFYPCSEKYEIAEKLISKKRYTYIIHLFDGGKTDRDRYYLVLAHKSLGNVNVAQEIADKISDGQLKAELSGILK